MRNAERGMRNGKPRLRETAAWCEPGLETEMENVE